MFASSVFTKSYFERKLDFIIWNLLFVNMCRLRNYVAHLSTFKMRVKSTISYEHTDSQEHSKQIGALLAYTSRLTREINPFHRLMAESAIYLDLKYCTIKKHNQVVDRYVFLRNFFVVTCASNLMISTCIDESCRSAVKTSRPGSA